MRNKTLGRWLGLLVALAVVIALGAGSSFLFFTLANYSEASERLISNISDKDSIETKNELVRLHYFYDLSKRWRIQWLADKYLFGDSPFYETADNYLVRDWQKVLDDLKDKQDDPRSYPYGNAKFRQAQSLYRAGRTKEALDMVTNEVASDFEKALRACLDSGAEYNSCFDRVWNYDLASNKKSAEEALKGPQEGPKPKFMLGPIKDKKGQPMVPNKGNKKKGDGKEGEEGGEGSPRKRP